MTGNTNNVIFRIPTPTFGRGLIEAIDDSAILANMTANAAQKAALGITGHENRNNNDGSLTRFGWKAQNKSLTVFSGKAYNVEQGVTNDVFPNERDSTDGCRFNATPEDHIDVNGGRPNRPSQTASDLINFVFFMRFLDAPDRGPASNSTSNGQALFSTVGCALCHTPSLITASNVTASLSNIPVNLFSDLLLHNMGNALADGISQGYAAGDEFRTAPLWGLGQRLFFLRDGRTSDLTVANATHASPKSEANAIIARYNALSAPAGPADRPGVGGRSTRNACAMRATVICFPDEGNAMNRWKRLLFAGCACALLALAYERTTTQGVMTTAAKAYLNALTPELRARAVFPLTADERMNWHFVPIERKGVALREMTSAQKHLAEALLSAGLSQQGVIKAHTIMSLDQVLKDMEKGTGPERDPEKYYVSVFGEPSEQGTWAYRFEGHHISLNFAIVNGRIASSPSFFGDNPAEVKEGPRAGLRALMREEDLGRAVVQALEPAQREIAIVDKTAPKDIITFDSRKAALNGQPSGLPFSTMNSKQKELLTDLVTEYATNFPPQIADFRLDQFRKNHAKLFFAWAGGIEKGEPHYYRIQTPVFLIEYDDTQNNANHIHSVWRDFEGDFGADLLAQHYQASHQ